MQYIIGDVHGNVNELKKLINHLNPKKEDLLIFLGDLIDKNPDTLETLEYITNLKDNLNCKFVKGNHDFVWEEYLVKKNLNRKEFLLEYGGKQALSKIDQAEELLKTDKITELKKILSKYLDIIKEMEPYLLVSDYLVIHAGLLPSQLDEEDFKVKEINYFLRPEKIDKSKKYLGKYRVIAGHTFIKSTPFFSEAYINIDTGAGYGKYLSVYCIENMQIMRSDGKMFKDKNE